MFAAVAKLLPHRFLRLVHTKESALPSSHFLHRRRLPLPVILPFSVAPWAWASSQPPWLIYNSAFARPRNTFEMLMLNANISFLLKDGGKCCLKKLMGRDWISSWKTVLSIPLKDLMVHICNKIFCLRCTKCSSGSLSAGSGVGTWKLILKHKSLVR